MDYRRYFPSKQFVFLLGSIMLAGLIIFGASLLGSGKKLSSVVSFTSEKTAANPNLVDSDSDGLPDWEEAVRGTDPHKADTDGDGTPDGEEVAALRNPLKVGPDDSLSSAEDAKFIAEFVAAASSTNLTDNISRTMFAEYVGASGTGKSGDPAAQQKIVSDLIAKASVGLKGKTYTQKDLVPAEESDVAVRTFANATIRAMHHHPTATFNNTVMALSGAIDSRDPASPDRLKAIGKEYRATARELAEIPTPPSLAADYLKVINAMENAGASFEDMSFILEDPVRSVAGFKNFNAMATIATNASVVLGTDIAKRNIHFVAGEPGGEWYVYTATMTGILTQ